METKKESKKSEADYERLPEIVDGFREVGIPGLTAKLVERTDKKAIYLRSDGIYEVFIVRRKKGNIVFGKFVPEHEFYPNSESFGAYAWSFNDRGEAMERYRLIP